MKIKISQLFFSLAIYLYVTTSALSSDVWTTYTKDNSDLPSNAMICGVIDDRGTKWFGTYNGMSIYFVQLSAGERIKTHRILITK